MDRNEIRSTFFVTGYLAEQKPRLVREIHYYGHEIASHGYKHVSLSSLENGEIQKSLTNSKRILSKITRSPIHGFRAPNFSFCSEFFQLLLDSGYTYDSSVHPAIVPGYYYNFKEPLEHYRPLKDKPLLEIPPSVFPGIRMPISWIWMRNLGNWIARYGVRANIKKRDVILYFHTWEFVEMPKVKGVPFYISRNTGSSFLQRLDKFIKEFKDIEFGKLEEAAK